MSNTTGSGDAAVGFSILSGNTTGTQNTAVGLGALSNNTTGFQNVVLGGPAGASVTTANNVICIDSTGLNISSSCFIGNIRGVTIAQMTPSMLIDSARQLGTPSSSRRFKKDIEPMNGSSEAILVLKPVTFHYKIDTANGREFGLIREEVCLKWILG